MECAYACNRCGHSCNNKSNLLAHLRRKTTCPATKADVETSVQIDLLLPKKEYNEKHYKCQYCESCFNTRQNRWRHLKKCKEKHEQSVIENLTIKMESLEKELQDVKKTTVSNTVNTTNTIKNQNNHIVSININNYGKETLDHLPNDFLTSCFMFKNMLSLVENIHFDPDCPQNKNIKLQSLKHKFVKVYEDDKWVAKPADHILDELVDKGQTILRRHYRNNKEEVEEEMSSEEVEEVVEWLAQIFENNERIRRPLKQELLALLENYR